jgi:hypothetical protein
MSGPLYDVHRQSSVEIWELVSSEIFPQTRPSLKYASLQKSLVY